MIHIAYDDRLLGWQLGKGHPTNPQRAKNAIHMLDNFGVDSKVHRISRTTRTRELLREVHSPAYVDATLEGWNDEWKGKRADLAKVATLMFQGTVDMVRLMRANGEGIYFSPQGAKHHAAYAQGSGFCVFNDFAWAAQSLAREGERVLYLDTDAHHGDGVEALTYGNTDVMTCSIHDSSIFPGTGNWDVREQRVFNWPLEKESGDAELVASVEEALAMAHRFDPTVILVAVGGDGHRDDPLSTLQYTLRGYAAAAEAVGTFAAERRAPVLVGGAGGYLPETATPAAWATFVSELALAYEAMYTDVAV